VSPLPLIRWDAPGPYRVAFSTRVGGVSGAPFDTLNLGVLTGDDAERVVENRRLLCGELELDPEVATMAWQQHGSRVVQARPEGIVTPETSTHEAADGIWSDARGQGLMLVAADCLPITLVRVNGGRPGVAVLHVGWKGLLGGIVAEGARALGGRLAGVIGPGIGPCCYEVRDDVAEPYRRVFGHEIVRGDRLDMWSAAERALRDAGCGNVERTDLCTSCHPELFFSHRRDGERTGRQGVLAAID
jgi:purine-nucleoside/S-methyl-5'-thioadenosine phosphorylase / adenosine deaminase